VICLQNAIHSSFLTHTQTDTKAYVLVSSRVQNAIQTEAATKGIPSAEVSKRAHEILGVCFVCVCFFVCVCVLCFVFCVLCFVFWVLCFVFCVLCFVFCVLCFVFCVLCFVFFVLCFVFCVLCFVFCVLCFVFCVLCFVFCICVLYLCFVFVFCICVLCLFCVCVLCFVFVICIVFVYIIVFVKVILFIISPLHFPSHHSSLFSFPYIFPHIIIPLTFPHTKVMAGDLRMPLLRVEAWFWRKIYRSFYNQIIVDESGLQRVKDIAKKCPIVVIPTHRSYVDFLLISYVFFHYQIPLPQIAAGDDFLNLTFINWMFRHSGAFFMRRGFGDDALYRAIFTEYVQSVLAGGDPLEFFIEGTRSRTGMSLYPKYGTLSIVLDALYDQNFESEMTDICVVAVALSYEKVVEGDAHVRELLGEPKRKMSSMKLLKEIPTKLIHSNFGKISVQFAEPISVRQFLSENCETNSSLNAASASLSNAPTPLPPPPPPPPPPLPQTPAAPPGFFRRSSSALMYNPNDPRESRGSKKANVARQGGGKEVKVSASLSTNENENDEVMSQSLTSASLPPPPLDPAVKSDVCVRLAHQIIADFHTNLMILSTSVVSAVVLLHRETGVSVEVCGQEGSWVRQQIVKRGGRVDPPNPQWVIEKEISVVHRAVSLLPNLFTVRNNVIEIPTTSSPFCGSVANLSAVMHMAIYRNQLIHVFTEDAIVFAAVCAVKEKRFDFIVNEVIFLRKLFEFEFVFSPLRTKEAERAEAERMIHSALHHGLIYSSSPLPHTHDSHIHVYDKSVADITFHRFLHSLFRPFLEVYSLVFCALSVWGEEKEGHLPHLLPQLQWLARRLYMEGRLKYGEVVSMVSLQYAMRTAFEMKVVVGKEKVVKIQNEMSVVLERLGKYFTDIKEMKEVIGRYPLIQSRL
jgi:1-acyl-sn-glycerol-3-phosphate acyltransferase